MGTNDNFSHEDIIRAEYFTQNNRIDVTLRVKQLLKDKQAIFANNLIAGDPEFGAKKKFEIEYFFERKVHLKEFKEGDKVRIP